MEAEELDESELCLSIGQTRLNASELGALAAHQSVKVRCRVAAIHDLPEPVIWRLAVDEHPRVRCSLAANESLPSFVLEALCEDEHPSVAARAERTVSSHQTTSFGEVIHWFFRKDLRQAG
jgi:hypothetical protein